jgi:phenylpyruvate tautomerase PptA (4-oxalocrotonate tautomerase family)
MPHVTVHAPEFRLSGRETALMAALADAVVGVYGEWARPHVVVRAVGVPAGRWSAGGAVDADKAPEVQFAIRASALERPDGTKIARALVIALTDAVVSCLEMEHLRNAVMVELQPQRDEHVALGGMLISDGGGSARGDAGS